QAFAAAARSRRRAKKSAAFCGKQTKRRPLRPPFAIVLLPGNDFGALLRSAAGSGRFTALGGLGLLLGFEILAGLLIDNLHRQPHLAALVEAEELDLHLVALLDHIARLLHSALRQLANMDETVFGAEEVH